MIALRPATESDDVFWRANYVMIVIFEKNFLSKIGYHGNIKVNKPTTSNSFQINLWKRPEVSGRLLKS